ncbi:MAG: GNAT family N-acetyltransferase [Patescibacteria group bacterium]
MNEISIRNYNSDTDYSGVLALYKNSSTYGGQYDGARDSEKRLRRLSSTNPSKILVAELEGDIVGTVTLFEDGRSAWLLRFAVQKEYEDEISKKLFKMAENTLKEMGHTQVLVYSPVNDKTLEERYTNLGLHKGNDYTAFWVDLS